MNAIEKYTFLKANCFNALPAQRILSEIGFLLNMSAEHGSAYHDIIFPTIGYLYDAFQEDGAITTMAADSAEKALLRLQDEAKKYRVIFVAHAHIDMNWTWGFQETAAITIDTFQTMLDLMEEYPEFTFSQSQASTYKIIEKYAPYMLPEIKKRIHEGRWELTASSWVEADKNMPNGESLARQILYAKKYLAKLFDVGEDSLALDFEPDTFGHSLNVPEILSRGGIKYYYHCRGAKTHIAYHWQAPSGAKVLCWREPEWYNNSVGYDICVNAPGVCRQSGSQALLKVYGVGDHGGGPTRRDIARIREIAAWPLYPAVEFGTYHTFFHALEQYQEHFPTVADELNFVFTGCYTSQSRIKMANRYSEDKINDSELLDSMAAMCCQSYGTACDYHDAWEKLLFNQFHDILPGSGTIETREYAMGAFQEILTAANSNLSHAMKAIAKEIDTSGIPPCETGAAETAIGAGVGFMLGQKTGFSFPRAERGAGSTRIFTLFNTTQYDRDEVTEITLWDWNGREADMEIQNAGGEVVPHKLTGKRTRYWGHEYMLVSFCAKVPATGYSTYALTCKAQTALPFTLAVDYRRDEYNDDNIVLENGKVCATFHPITMKLISYRDIITGEELIDTEKPACGFRYILEDPGHGLTAWIVGERTLCVDINETEPVTIVDASTSGLRKHIRYQIPFQHSKLDVKVILDENSSALQFAVEVDWHEIGTKEAGIPQLQFFVPYALPANRYRYDIPFGTIERARLNHDVCPNSYIAAIPDRPSSTLMLTTDSKYGFRGCDNSMMVNLIRSSFDPDRYPEYGIQNMRLGLFVCREGSVAEEVKNAALFAHPLYYCANTNHPGTLPLCSGILKVEGAVKISCIKSAENGDARIIRLYSLANESQMVALVFAKPAIAASLVDLNENDSEPGVTLLDNRVEFVLSNNSIATLKVAF